MKAQSIAFYSVAAALTFSYLASKPEHTTLASRKPASSNIVNVQVTVKNEQPTKTIVVNNKEVKALKSKLSQLEIKLKAQTSTHENEIAELKEALKQAKDPKEVNALKKEIADISELLKNSKSSDEIELLKNEIAELKKEIKEKSSIENDELQNSLCLSQRHEAELEKQVKKQLEDKEDILKQFEAFKTEMKMSKAPVAPTVVPAAAPANFDIVALMGQITSLLQSQQQMQMQFQTQMFSMFPQTQYGPSMPSFSHSYPQSLSNLGGGMYGPGMGMGMGYPGMEIGGYNSMIQNPYSQIPMERTQIPFDSGFNFSPTPTAMTIGGGFNFSNNLPSIADSFTPPMMIAAAT